MGRKDADLRRGDGVGEEGNNSDGEGKGKGKGEGEGGQQSKKAILLKVGSWRTKLKTHSWPWLFPLPARLFVAVCSLLV